MGVCIFCLLACWIGVHTSMSHGGDLRGVGCGLSISRPFVGLGGGGAAAMGGE